MGRVGRVDIFGRLGRFDSGGRVYILGRLGRVDGEPAKESLTKESLSILLSEIC